MLRRQPNQRSDDAVAAPLPCALTDYPQLVDPMTKAISFMLDPGPFRLCCTLTDRCWNHALYLEGELPCPTTVWNSSGQVVPVNALLGSKGAKQVDNLRFYNIPDFNPSTWDIKLCRSLTHLHMEKLANFKQVEDCWLHQCTSLKEVSFKDLTALESVGGDWLHQCTSLEQVHFDGLSSLKQVRRCWLCQCTALKEVSFNGLTALESVGDYWLYQCTSLEQVHFDGLSSLKQVGRLWLRQCTTLKEVSFNGLTALESVGDDWLCECTSLEKVYLELLFEQKLVVPQHIAEKCLQMAVDFSCSPPEA